MTVLADTGVLIAVADRREPRHASCAAVLRAHHGQMAMTAPAVAEASWMIESRLGPEAEARFLGLVTTGEINVVDLTRDDYLRCVELIHTYADMGLGLVDASIVTLAERLGIAHHRYAQPPGLHRGPPRPHRSVRAHPLTTSPPVPAQAPSPLSSPQAVSVGWKTEPLVTDPAPTPPRPCEYRPATNRASVALASVLAAVAVGLVSLFGVPAR